MSVAIPITFRKNFCAFRISVHELEIERGRYTRPHKHPEDCLCPLCKKEVETEMHFLLICSHLANVRKNFIISIVRKYANFLKLCTLDRMYFLLKSSDYEVITTTMNLITELFKTRKHGLLTTFCESYFDPDPRPKF